MTLIHYIIVRRDLPLGVVCSMIAHAAGESATLYADPLDGRFRHAIAVVLEVKSENALYDAERLLRSRNIPYVAISESGGPYDGQFMSIGLVPGDRDKIGPILAEFQTLKVLDKTVDL